ncbi:MAG: hypothetical protein NWE88_07095 [Candidatus Bathyarchaeota archaeon]|nr:hypothetical protein [Candidatus Bathyarchaeota archaeon]
MVVEFECVRCKNIVPVEQYELSKFCPDCGTFLRARRIKTNEKRTGTKIVQIDLRPEDINVESLFYEYTHFTNIDVGQGKVFPTVSSWVSARKQAYLEYKEKFAPEKLHDLNQLKKDYRKWLLFKNNHSWTTYQRSGTKATETPLKIANLLFLLQDETVSIEERVSRGLDGKEKVPGIANGILTALLHTLNCEKYGVWNSRTKDTLKLLRRPPRGFQEIGAIYKEVNSKLNKLARELKTDLTNIDGFMWYISKKVRVIK